ncbi:hypothetical protein RIF29_27752 [Crotalaria pallida]|uniref:RING-type E3 ubiquitin transferase n=1 Tax=Crotalaria pallida TaxID=3830 RepID=A0AAN9ERU1_CROPI
MNDDNSERWMPKDVCLVIVVFVFFLVLNFCNNLKSLASGGRSSSPHRNQVQRRLFDVSIPNGTSLQLQNLGLECCVINSLPMFQFKKNEGREGEQKKTINADCVICLGEFEDSEWLKHLPNCNHGFHVCCIDKWFQSHSNCPLCRSPVHRVANQEYSVSSYTLLEPLRRENYSRDRSAHLQSFRSEILQSLAIRQQSSHN